MKFFLVALFSYLIGSIPFSYIIAKIFFKKDIRIMGSGNPGTTNVFRNFGASKLALNDAFETVLVSKKTIKNKINRHKKTLKS